MSTEVAASIEDAEELKGQVKERKPTGEEVIAAHKQRTMREQIAAAYEAYLRGEPTSEKELLELVRKFVYRKVRRLEYEYRNERETAQRADDWTQDALKSIWIALPRLPETTPTGEAFYSYINTTAINRRAKAGGYLVKRRMKMFLSSSNVKVTTARPTRTSTQKFITDAPRSTKVALCFREASWVLMLRSAT